MWTAPDSVLIGSRWGCLVTALGAVVMVVGGLLSLFAVDRAAAHGRVRIGPSPRRHSRQRPRRSKTLS